ncbi:hypothetical protein [Thermoflexus sp.]|uniref:hypothetical protein n=1 Tax=Thermoflexus sp. TaxID=1969742 RepID=UPI0035E464BB
MRQVLLRLLLLLFTTAFGISGAIWVGIHLGAWGLAVMVGVAMGTMMAFLLVALGIQRANLPDPYAGVGRDGHSGWMPGAEGYGFPTRIGAGAPGRGPSGTPGLPLLGMPWIPWIAWMPGPPVPDFHRSWPLPPPPAPRTFTVIGEEGEEE